MKTKLQFIQEQSHAAAKDKQAGMCVNSFRMWKEKINNSLIKTNLPGSERLPDFYT